MFDHIADDETRTLLRTYVAKLNLPTDQLQVTTSRSEFEGWLGRRVDASIGGGYAFHRRGSRHLVLINLPRIDRSKPRSLEIVVAEELVHMRDRLDGDLRRHAKHGYDRIAYRVAELTGASLEEIRSCLVPRRELPARYHYQCPRCRMTVQRKRKGTWSCGRCSTRFDPALILRLVQDDLAEGNAA